MPESKIPRAPLHLGSAGKRLWRRVMQVYELAEWQHDILEAACSAADRLAEARQIIAADGLVVATGINGTKANPAIKIENDARIALLRSLRELALAPEDVAEAPRPAQIAGRYHRTGA